MAGRRKAAEGELTLRDLNRATLARQMLLRREELGVLRAIERLAGMQAQVPRPPFVGLWTRLTGFARADLLRALERRQVVRATSMRGTIHLMTARDYRALRAAIQPCLDRALAAILAERLEGVDTTRLIAAGEAFFREEPRTFDALRKALEGRKLAVPAADVRAQAFAVRMLLPLVQVPEAAPWGFPAAARFAVASDWLGGSVLEGDPSPHALVRRYLAAFGPATATDAQVWSGLQPLRPVLEALAGKLVVLRGPGGRAYYDLPDAPRPQGDTPAPVRFLPEFDNLLLSHADRTRVLADAHRPHVLSKNLQVRATFLVDGFVAGTWRIARTRAVATLTVEPLIPLPAKTKAALTEEATPLAHFLEPDAPRTEVRFAKG